MAFATSEGVWHPALERLCDSGARDGCGQPHSQTVLKSEVSLCVLVFLKDNASKTL